MENDYMDHRMPTWLSTIVCIINGIYTVLAFINIAMPNGKLNLGDSIFIGIFELMGLGMIVFILGCIFIISYIISLKYDFETKGEKRFLVMLSPIIVYPIVYVIAFIIVGFLSGCSGGEIPGMFDPRFQ